jgi:hypothetical protein
MHISPQSYRQKKNGFACSLLSGIFVLGLALAAPAAAGMGAGGGGSGAAGGAGATGGGAGASAGGSGASTGGGGGGGTGGGGTIHHLNQTDLTTCLPGTVSDARHQKCFVSRSRVLPASKLTE